MPQPLPHKVVAYRTLMVDVQIIAPTAGALEDFEKELRAKIRRVVNTQATQKRHGVVVNPPGMPRRTLRPWRDSDFWCTSTVVPPSRRTRHPDLDHV